MSTSVSQIVLVGLPGAGKSTVGSILADLIGWNFVDLDQAIERDTGLTVAQIFAQLGEAEFRRLEAELTAGLASEKQLVLAPGGGWIANAALPGMLLQDAVMIWLRVQPQTALARLRATGVARPLLEVPDALRRLQTLFAERRPYYERAHSAFDTDNYTPREVAETILEWLKRQKKSVLSS